MASAVSDLNQMIERIRKEADAAGYARAWAEMKAFVEGSQKGSAVHIDLDELPKPGERTGRAPKGTNRRRVEGALLWGVTTPATVLQIKNAVDADGGAPVAYSSVQQALMQLKDAGVAVPTGERGTWTLRAPSSDPHKSAKEGHS